MYITVVERQLERNVKIIRSDKGGKYYGKYDESGQCLGPFAKLFEKHGICACRGIRPRNSFMYIMSLGPKPRTRGRPRKVEIVKGAYVSK